MLDGYIYIYLVNGHRSVGGSVFGYRRFITFMLVDKPSRPDERSVGKPFNNILDSVQVGK